MLEIDEAKATILECISQVCSVEPVPIDQATGRVLARDIISTVDVPPAANSAMDGIAVTFDDLRNAKDGRLPLTQRVVAGKKPRELVPNSAARIFTGAEMPFKSDTVIIQENCEFTDKDVKISGKISKGDNVRAKGQDIKKGESILKSGRILKAQDIGLIASAGQTHVQVFKKLRITLISTGSELIQPGEPLTPGKIYNSNQAMLHALLSQRACYIVNQYIVQDSFDKTRVVLKEAASKSDLILSTGGVSVGEEDHVKDAVESLGGLDVWKVKMKPGKPLAFGKIGDTVFLGLPGNPVSSFVVCCIFGFPIIRKMQGADSYQPLAIQLPIAFDVPEPQSRPEFMRVRIENNFVMQYGNQSSGVLSSVSWANALAFIPADTTLNQGDLVDVYPLELM